MVGAESQGLHGPSAGQIESQGNWGAAGMGSYPSLDLLVDLGYWFVFVVLRFVGFKELPINLVYGVWVDLADQDLIEDHPREPLRHVLRIVVRQLPQHRPRGFANKHNLPLRQEHKNPAAKTFADIDKILDFHSPTMTQSAGLSSGREREGSKN